MSAPGRKRTTAVKCALSLRTYQERWSRGRQNKSKARTNQPEELQSEHLCTYRCLRLARRPVAAAGTRGRVDGTMNGPLGIFARVLINAIFLLVLSATAVEGRSLLGDNEAATVYQARDLLARANQCIVDKDYRRADYLLTGLFSSPGFQQFEVHERLEAYRAKVQALIELERFEQAYALSVEATASPAATAADWLQRIAAAYLTGRRDDAVSSLSALVQKWPAEAGVTGDDVFLAVTQPGYGDAARRAALHAELLDLSTRSAVFRKRAELLTQLAWRSMNVQLDAAASDLPVGQRPFVLAAMRADHRYDAIVAADPLYFDPEAATLKQLDQLREEDVARGNYLQPSVEMLHIMPVVQMNEAAVRLANNILSVRTRWRFADRVDYRPLIGDFKARALWQQDRFADAVNVLDVTRFNRIVAPAERVRLGWAYAMLGEPTEAWHVVQPSMGSFSCGWPELETLLLAIAAQQHREQDVSRILDRTSAYQGTAFWFHQWGLVAANRLNEAAQRLIENLRDPARRLHTLMQIQSYAQPEGAVWETIVLARWRGLLDRPDVRQALAEVGRIDGYPISMPFRRAMLGAPDPYREDRLDGLTNYDRDNARKCYVVPFDAPVDHGR
jgi:hypothetical protein